MTRRLGWTALLCLALLLLMLVVRRDEETIAGLSTVQFGSLAIMATLLIFVGGGVLAMFRGQLFQALEAAVFWVVLGLLLAVGYSYRFELRDVGDRLLGELMPGRSMSHGRTVEIARTRNGDFQVGTQVNGARIAMVLDTGASAVVLTQEAAKAAGLPLEVLSYTVSVDTANGRTHAAPVTLDRLSVGSLIERAVPALIAQPGQLKVSLLGMSFLNRLESWEVRADKLMMRGYP
ncbi:MAG: TIGR02281 family clan AA aspartic protease [Xanthobacteraceae bacterium]